MCAGFAFIVRACYDKYAYEESLYSCSRGAPPDNGTVRNTMGRRSNFCSSSIGFSTNRDRQKAAVQRIRICHVTLVRLAAGGKLSNILLKPEEISESAGETPNKWLEGAKSEKFLLSLAKQETVSNQTAIK